MRIHEIRIIIAIFTVFISGNFLIECGSQLACMEGTFSCNNSEKCIPQHNNCDGRVDCTDHSDEWLCDDKDKDNYFNQRYVKRPNADLYDRFNANCTLTNFVHNKCSCKGAAIFCDHQNLFEPPKLNENASVELLELTGNSFRKLIKYDFRGLSSIRTIILNHGELEEMENGIFKENPNLTALYLDHNKLRSLPTNWFFVFNSLEILRVGYNSLTNLEEGTFRNLNQLIELDIRKNKITILRKEVLQHLTKLKKLFLNENKIEIISNQSFPYLGNLIKLSLTENRIREIQPGSFNGLPRLHELYLSGNNLNKLSSGIFENLHQLLSIYFDDFSLCSAALKVRVCEPKGDGISSLDHLLDNIVLRASVWIMCILACGGNILVLLGRLLVKEPNAVHSFYIKNLSLSDLLMGIYLMLIASADMKYRGNYVEHQEEWRASSVCLFSGFLNTLSSESSVLILCLITWDRLVSITKPLAPRQQNTNEAKFLLFALWATALILSAAPLFGGKYFGNEFYTSNGVCLALHIHNPYAQGWEYSAAMFMGLNTIGLTFISYAYIKMLRVIKSSALALRSTQERQDRVVAQRFAIIVATDCLCWIPVIIIKFIALSGVKIAEELYAWLAIFVLPINSALNPILYTLATTLFKQQISRLLYNYNKQGKGSGKHGSALSLSVPGNIQHRKQPFTGSKCTQMSFANSRSSLNQSSGATLGSSV